MYKILTLETGDVVYTSALLYVKKNPASGAWIRVDNTEDAEAVAVAGRLLNLPNKPKIDGFDTAVIRNLDVAANLQAVEKLSDQSAADVSTIVNAVCEIGEENAVIMDAVLELSDKLEEVIDHG